MRRATTFYDMSIFRSVWQILLPHSDFVRSLLYSISIEANKTVSNTKNKMKEKPNVIGKSAHCTWDYDNYYIEKFCVLFTSKGCRHLYVVEYCRNFTKRDSMR